MPTSSEPPPKVAVMLDARQKASDRTRTGAREAHERKKSRETAIRAQVRREMQQESSCIRARAEAEVTARGGAAAPLAAQASRACEALSVLAAYRREEGLDADREDHYEQTATDLSPKLPNTSCHSAVGAGERGAKTLEERQRSEEGSMHLLSGADAAKLELIQALSRAKLSADAELKDLATRRAARHAETRVSSRASSSEAVPKSSLFHWSVGMDLGAAAPRSEQGGKKQSVAAEAAWGWAQGATSSAG